MKKSPAFQFYPGDFFADSKVIVMTAEEVGAYWLLISSCWIEGKLSGDMEDMAVIARLPVDKFQTSWEKRIKRCFEQREDGVWIHPRLEVERQHQAENREKKRHAALKRYEKHPPGEQKGCTSSAAAVQMQCPSTSSSTPTPTPPSGEERDGVSRAKARSTSHRSNPCDEEYLEELQKNPAYERLNVRECFHKMVAWCQVKGKHPTRARLVNWLNREDRPMTALAAAPVSKFSRFAETPKTANNDAALEAFKNGVKT